MPPRHAYPRAVGTVEDNPSHGNWPQSSVLATLLAHWGGLGPLDPLSDPRHPDSRARDC